jgi:hypothetical protein
LIKSSFLYLIYKSGDIASQLDQLYDEKLRGREISTVVGKGQVSIDYGIKLQEKRLKKFLSDIQKGYKTSGIEE